MSYLMRGNVYWADLGAGRKPYLVVSNNDRNRHLASAVVVRLTTTLKPPLSTIIDLTGADYPLVGRVLCDDIMVAHEDDYPEHAGALSPATMRRVEGALRIVLAL